MARSNTALAYADALDEKFGLKAEVGVISGIKYDRIVVARVSDHAKFTHGFVERVTGRLFKTSNANRPNLTSKGYTLDTPEEFAQAVKDAEPFTGYPLSAVE